MFRAHVSDWQITPLPPQDPPSTDPSLEDMWDYLRVVRSSISGEGCGITVEFNGDRLKLTGECLDFRTKQMLQDAALRMFPSNNVQVMNLIEVWKDASIAT